MTLTALNLPAFAAFSDQGNGSGTITFTPGFDDGGSYPGIQIIASESVVRVLSDTATFTLTVGGTNRAPVVAAIADDSMDVGEVLNIPVSASDPDGNTLVLQANLPSFGALTDNGNGTGNLQFSPGSGDVGNHLIEVIALDNGSPQLTDTTRFTLSVIDFNDPPVLTAIANQSVNEGATLDVSVTASDPNSNTLTLTVNNLPSFGTFSDNGGGNGLIHFAPTFADSGEYSIEVIASDNGTPQLFDTTNFLLTVTDQNRPPQIAAISDQTVAETDTLEIAISATDLDGDSMAIAVANLPGFGSFTDNGDGTGLIRFLPTFADSGTYPGIEVQVTDDGQPVATGTEIFSLTVTNKNRLPIAVSDADTTNEDVTLRISPLANDSDPDGEALTILALILNGSNGQATIEPGDTTIAYEPPADSSGVDQFNYVISDGSGGLDTATVTVVINPVNDAPTLTNLPDSLSFFANDSVSLDVFSAVADVETADSLLTFAFTASPDTLLFDFDQSGGLLSVSAKNPATMLVVETIITVSDPQGASASDTVQITVKTPVGIGDVANGIPTRFELQQNYPNPFNPVTTIRFGLPQNADVRIDIFNLLGQRVATILDAHKPAGIHEIQFDGQKLASGIYYYHLQASSPGQSGKNIFNDVKRMVLLK